MSAPDEPTYRVALLRSSVDYVRGHDDGEAILAELGPERLREIEQGAPGDYLPYAYHMVLLEALYTKDGRHAVRDLTAFNVRQSISSPVFSVLRLGFLGTFGLRPSTILNAVPRGVRKSGRNMGRIDIDVDAKARTAKTIWHRLPESMRRPCVAWAHTSTYQVLLTWAGALDVEVEVRLGRLEHGEAHYEIRWVE